MIKSNHANFLDVNHQDTCLGYPQLRNLRLLPIPLISPPDSEGKCHAIPMEVATLFRIMSPLRGRSEATLVFGCLS
jgi:hypothetical protein